MKPLSECWPTPALAFRGYNAENLGRTPELLEHPCYSEILLKRLLVASEVCADVLGRPVDLARRVRERSEPVLAEYSEAVALLFATETAQLDMLREVHGLDYRSAEISFGYSLGELVALAASGALIDEQALRVPLEMAPDSALLAQDVTMGVLFSRELPIDEGLALQLCDEISEQGRGVLAVSAVLSPNTLLLLGQGRAIDSFRERMPDAFPSRVHLRINDSQWPPLHTPIVRQKHIPDRASVLIQLMEIGRTDPQPPVLSLVTGEMAGAGVAVRRLLRDWVDHPQRLWDAVCGVLRSPTQTIIHIGPKPNVIPATFHRLSENILQLRARNDLSGFGARAISRIVERPWLSSRAPKSLSLMRAPTIQQVILEDWLLDNAPPIGSKN